MDDIKTITDKISQYDILTNIIPGTILCVVLRYWVGYNIIPPNWFQSIFIFYFAGMVCNRIGSLVVEPIFKECGKRKKRRKEESDLNDTDRKETDGFASYDEFIQAEKIDEKITILNRENNVYRTYIATSFLLLVFDICKMIYELCFDWKSIVLLLLIVLFVFSYKKQIGRIRYRVLNNIRKILREHYEEQ